MFHFGIVNSSGLIPTHHVQSTGALKGGGIAATSVAIRIATVEDFLKSSSCSLLTGLFAQRSEVPAGRAIHAPDIPWEFPKTGDPSIVHTVA